MITMILASAALAAAGFALSLAEGTGAPSEQRRKFNAVAARVAQAALPVGLFAAAYWGDYREFALALVAGWVVGALVGTAVSVARWRGVVETPAVGQPPANNG